jgi:hypothetical protein
MSAAAQCCTTTLHNRAAAGSGVCRSIAPFVRSGMAERWMDDKAPTSSTLLLSIVTEHPATALNERSR